MKSFKYLIILLLLINSCKKDDTKTNDNDYLTNSGFSQIEKASVVSMKSNSILVDSKGYKWIGTDSGLILFNNSNWFKYNKIANVPIFSIQKYKDEILVAASDGAYTITPGDDEIMSSDIIEGSNTGSSSDTIYVYVIDKYDNSWIGSPDGLAFNNGSGWLRNKQIKLNLGGLKEIRSLTFRYNEVFFSTFGKFLYHLKLKETAFDAVSGASQMIGGAENPINNFNGQLTTDTIFCVYADTDTALWFGSKDGLTRNKGNTHVSSGLFEYFLRGERIHCIIETSDKEIWAGSENGLFIRHGEQWLKYSTSDGLPDNIITCISEDIDHSLWIGTTKGLSHYINGKFVY